MKNEKILWLCLAVVLMLPWNSSVAHAQRRGSTFFDGGMGGVYDGAVRNGNFYKNDDYVTKVKYYDSNGLLTQYCNCSFNSDEGHEEWYFLIPDSSTDFYKGESLWYYPDDYGSLIKNGGNYFWDKAYELDTYDYSYIYDDVGRVLKCTKYCSGKVLDSNEFEYDEKNRIVKYNWEFERFDGESEYEYDGDRLSKVTTTILTDTLEDDTGNKRRVKSWVTFDYNDSGYISAEYIYEDRTLLNGTLLSSGKYEYDQYGNLAKYTCYNSDGSLNYYEVYESNNKNVIPNTFEIPIKEKKVFTAPTISAAVAEDHSVTLAWEPVDKAVKFVIFRSESADGEYRNVGAIEDGSATSFSDHSVTEGVTYYYRVDVTSKESETVTSNTVSAEIPKSDTANYSIGTPVIKSVEKSGNDIILHWEKVSAGDGYILYRSTDNVNFEQYKVISSPSTTAYTDTNAANGQEYYYRISAYKGSTSEQSPISPTYVIKTKQLDGTLQTKLISVTKKAKASGKVTIKWKKTAGASGYLIYRKKGNDSYHAFYTVNNANKTAINDVKLSKGVKYSYYVVPFKNESSNGLTVKYLGRKSNVKSKKL